MIGHLNRESLEQLAEGSLPAQDVRMVQTHLEACAACRRELDAARRYFAAMKAMPAVPASREFASHVRARIEAEEKSRWWRRLSALLVPAQSPWGAAGIGAVLGGLVLAGFFGLRGGEDAPTVLASRDAGVKGRVEEVREVLPPTYAPAPAPVSPSPAASALAEASESADGDPQGFAAAKPVARLSERKAAAARAEEAESSAEGGEAEKARDAQAETFAQAAKPKQQLNQATMMYSAGNADDSEGQVAGAEAPEAKGPLAMARGRSEPGAPERGASAKQASAGAVSDSDPSEARQEAAPPPLPPAAAPARENLAMADQVSEAVPEVALAKKIRKAAPTSAAAAEVAASASEGRRALEAAAPLPSVRVKLDSDIFVPAEGWAAWLRKRGAVAEAGAAHATEWTVTFPSDRAEGLRTALDSLGKVEGWPAVLPALPAAPAAPEATAQNSRRLRLIFTP